MAGDEPHNTLTAGPRLYNAPDALKEAKRQKSLPYHKQSRWYSARTGSRIYFTGI